MREISVFEVRGQYGARVWAQLTMTGAVIYCNGKGVTGLVLSGETVIVAELPLFVAEHISDPNCLDGVNVLPAVALKGYLPENPLRAKFVNALNERRSGLVPAVI